MSTPSNCQLYTNSFNLLRFPLALLVVLVHVFSVSPSTFNIPTIYDSVSFLSINRFINVFLLGIPVPVYFFISGYFFFSGSRFTIDTYKSKLKNRFHSLFIPYLIWNSVAIIVVVLKDLPVFSSLLTYAGTSTDLDINNILSCFWEYNGRLSPPPEGTVNFEQYVKPTPYPINTALWYIRDLMIIVLLTPAIRLCVLKCNKYFVIVLGALYCWSVFVPLNAHLCQLLTGFFFFSWGAYFRLNAIDVDRYFSNGKCLMLICFIANGFICLASYNCYPFLTAVLKLINSILAVGVLYSISSAMIKRYAIILNRNLIPFGYFIYISHCIISSRFTKLLMILFQPTRGYEVTIIYMFSFFLVIFSLYFIYMTMQRFMPQLLRIMVGGK